MKLITSIIFALLVILNSVNINSQVIENNSKVVMSEADISSLSKTLKKYKKTKNDLTENNNLKQVIQLDNTNEIDYLRKRLALLENQPSNFEVYRINSQDNDYKIRAMQNEILQLRSLLNNQKLSSTTENDYPKQFSELDNANEIKYLRQRLSQLENQTINPEVYRNDSVDNDYRIRAIQDEILQLQTLLNNQQLSSITENDQPKQFSELDNANKNKYLRQRLEQLESQRSNPDVYRNTSQDNDYRIRAMQNEILQLQSLLNNKKLRSETNNPNIVYRDKATPSKSDEIKIVYAENLKREKQHNIQYTIDPINSALKVAEVAELSKITKQNEPNQYNDHLDSIQKTILDLKKTINTKNTIDTKNESPIKYDSLTSDYLNYKKQLFFDNNKKELDLNQIVILDGLVSILAKNDNIDVFIKGFASKKGNPIYNENLSLQRTESAKKMLVSKGIHPTRILTKYYGIDYESATDELARRVDIELLIRK